MIFELPQGSVHAPIILNLPLANSRIFCRLGHICLSMDFPAHLLQPLLQLAAFAKIALVSESIDPVSSEPAIEVRGLHKSYGSVEAVRGIDLRVAKGEVFALLGPNGAGKTTTIEILEGYLQKDVR